MLALCLMLSGTYYAKNYAGIIGRGAIFFLGPTYHVIFYFCLRNQCHPWLMIKQAPDSAKPVFKFSAHGVTEPLEFLRWH